MNSNCALRSENYSDDLLPPVDDVTHQTSPVSFRCGDEIVAVNGATTVGMKNNSLIPMLKLQKNRVTLTVVSWPGTLV